WKQFGPLLQELTGHEIPVRWADWRPGDQRIYVSDIGKARRDLGWQPKVGVREGIERLYRWVIENRELF
ncbi:MAG TPA: GDP-mannose 4,6-dehydratase, partial [Anaerolineaceae bacterium]|nr:GDP-mannose 4,6-dehydratase [Anaerolineaceae bacterium]